MMKLWGGRFRGETAPEAASFLNSFSFDKRLYRQDIRGSIAHAQMLGSQGIIPPEEAELLVRGLEEILQEIEEGRLSLEGEYEDIHSFVEARLVEKVGDVGKKLHTGRSRNDQVATDLRLYLKEEIRAVAALLLRLVEVLLARAEEAKEVIMPGYTHLQRAQPVTFAHHLLAYCEMFRRDFGRLQDCLARLDVCPLGAGALAGSTFPLDREGVARALGFREAAWNTLDAVSDRDFVAEFLFAASLLMVHLSRFAEEIVLWSSAEFGFVEVDDAYATGSSLMPQKKNPDVAELVRGKTGRVLGHLVGILTVLKGLPLSYNKDLQEDKEALFDAVDTVKACLGLFAPLVATLRLNVEQMRAAAASGFTGATDLAEYLVRRGVPVREAHEVVGRIVRFCLEKNKGLEELSLAAYRSFHEAFGPDLYDCLRVEEMVARRALLGGPAPAAVAAVLERLREWTKEAREFLQGGS